MKDYQELLRLFMTRLDDYRAGLNTQSPKELYDPENYILALGGKRLRPLLALIATDLFDKDPASALDAALAIELFHNFSLMHDDILDAAPLRRNQPTVHVKWNTNIAILSGDTMLVKAFAVLNNYNAEQFKTLSVLFHTTAVEVCEGQQEDMNFEHTETVTAEDYIRMITFKTAVLLGCSLQMGAICAGADDQDQKNLYLFGKHLGIAFQLLDDYLDAFAGDPEKFGKQVGGDILANKKTFLLLKALELSSVSQREALHKLLKHETNAVKKISSVLALFADLNIGPLCMAEADKHTQLAVSYLEKIKASSEKKIALKNFSLELLKREV